MENKNLIDIGVQVDLDKLLDGGLLIQASSGYGKSTTIRKLAEMISGKVQQIILDREGDFVSLREKFDFALISVEGGDIPLSVRYAETIAIKLMETKMSAIIDLYDLKIDERVLFVKRFCTALINIQKDLWHSCLVYIDEAHLFAPEGKASESADAVINLCSQGRKRGIRVVLATQRLSKLNKDATADCMNKMIGATGQDIDRKRAGDELGFVSKENVLNLRNLERGEFYGFGPAISREVIKFKVGKVQTSHPSSDNRMISIPPTPKAIKKIVAKLAGIPQEAEKELETKKQLTNEIARLKHELRSTKAAGSVTKKVEPAVNPKTTKLENDVKRLEDQLSIAMNQKATKENENKELRKLLQANVKDFSILNKTMGAAAKMMEGGCAIALNGSVARDPKFIEPDKEVITRKLPDRSGTIRTLGTAQQKDITNLQQPLTKSENDKKFNRTVENAIGNEMTKVQRVVMTTMAPYFPDKIPKRRIAILSGYSPKKSTIRNIFTGLRANNWVQETTDEMGLTEDGLQALGDYEPLPTDGGSLLEYWKDQLTPEIFKLLKYLYDHANGDYMTRQQVADGTGHDLTVSTIRNKFTILRGLGLIDESGKDKMKIADDFLN